MKELLGGNIRGPYNYKISQNGLSVITESSDEVRCLERAINQGYVGLRKGGGGQAEIVRKKGQTLDTVTFTSDKETIEDADNALNGRYGFTKTE